MRKHSLAHCPRGVNRFWKKIRNYLHLEIPRRHTEREGRFFPFFARIFLIPPSAAQTPPLMPSASKGAFGSCRTRHFPLLLNAPGFSPFAKESPGLFDPLFKKPALFFVPSSLREGGETGGMGKIRKTACKKPALTDRPFVFVQLALKLLELLAVGKRYRLRNDQLLVNVVAL